MFFVLVLSASALSSVLLLWALIPCLRTRLMDLPNSRSSHKLPTPRAGGLVFVLLVAFACIFDFFFNISPGNYFNSVFLLALPLAFVGFLDDRHNLFAGYRYIFQLATALLMVSLSGLPLSLFVLPFLVIALTAVTNFTNFMDGLDGLVSGCMIINLSVLGVVLQAPWTLWVLVGSLLGFLAWNWSPSKVFMGDVGSTFLGGVYGGLLLQACCWQEALGLLLVATPLLADAASCVLRRFISRHQVFRAHRLHLFQRLHQAGWTHSRVALVYLIATGTLAVAMLTGGLPLVFWFSLAVVLFGVWLDQNYAVPFAVASNS